jgi:hypothetical protein
MDGLRDTARDRWRRAHEQEQQWNTGRRLAVLFLFSLAVTLCLLLSAEIAAQHIAGPTAQQIEKGLGR